MERQALRRIDGGLPPAERHGEWTGLAKLSRSAVGAVREASSELLAGPQGAQPEISALLNRLVAGGFEVRVAYTAGNWLDVDTLYDVIQAGKFGGR